MSMVRTLIPLLVATALLLSANGMQNTILALRAIEIGFADFTVGLLYSAYFVGFILGCRFAPRFISNVGHVRAFTAFASIASSATLAYTLLDVGEFWLVLRVVSGFCMASLYMILESWLNEISTNETRGRILSIYRITDFSTVTLAQASVGFFDPVAFTVFVTMSIAVSLALVPVALTRVTQPSVPATAKLNLKRLWQLSPMAAATALGVGLGSSAFWGLSPVFVTSQGYGTATVGLFMGATILGGALAQWPLGWLSDKVDRRQVLVGCAIGGMVTSAMIPFVATLGETALIVAGAAFGAFALPNFGLAVAHANDHAEPGTYVSVNGGLLMLYGLAAIVGPIAVPLLIPMLTEAVIFGWVAVVYGALVVFSLYRLTQRAAPAVQEPFVAVPRTTPAVFELDPRAEEDGAEDESGTAPQPAA